MKQKIKRINDITLEKIKGWFSLKNTIIAGLFGTLGVLIPYLFLKEKASPSIENKLQVTEPKNSPSANNIGTQNIYYGDTSEVKAPPVTQKKSSPASTKRKSEKESEVVINADNAGIITNGQSGGSNTLVVKPEQQKVIEKN